MNPMKHTDITLRKSSTTLLLLIVSLLIGLGGVYANVATAQQVKLPIELDELRELLESNRRIEALEMVTVTPDEEGYIVYVEAELDRDDNIDRTAEELLALTHEVLPISSFTAVLYQEADEAYMLTWSQEDEWTESEPAPTEELRQAFEEATGISLTMTYYALSNANVRSCSETTCDVVGGLVRGQAVTVLSTAEGQAVNAGDTLWYEIVVDDDETGFVYGALLTDQEPIVVQQPPVQQQSIQQQPVQQQQPTVQQSVIVSTEVPISTPVPPPPGPTSPYTCNGIDDLNCGDFARWSDANAHFQACGDEDRLDGDNDGNVCESLR